MGYTEYFNLEREPFSNAPSERFYFNSDQHNQALLRLMYSVDSDKGLAVLVGGVGTGKTTLARRMLDNLPVDKYESSLLVMIHSGITPEWLLSRIALQLGVKIPDTDPLKILKQLYERLLQIHSEGRKAVVLIDEAQMLQSRALMEEFRGLLNLEIPGKKLLNVVFFGLSELEQTMKLDAPLAQRVALKYILKPLSAETTHSYIEHRLRIAGSKDIPFEEPALDKIHQFSGGVPRLINTLADNAMLETFLRHDKVVTEEMVDSVAVDLGLSKPSENKPILAAVISAPEVVQSEPVGSVAPLSEPAESAAPLDEEERNETLVSGLVESSVRLREPAKNATSLSESVEDEFLVSRPVESVVPQGEPAENVAPLSESEEKTDPQDESEEDFLEDLEVIDSLLDGFQGN